MLPEQIPSERVVAAAAAVVVAVAVRLLLLRQTLEAWSSGPVHACMPGRPAASANEVVATRPLVDAVAQTDARAEEPWDYAGSTAKASYVLESEAACGDVSLAGDVQIGRTGRDADCDT